MIDEEKKAIEYLKKYKYDNEVYKSIQIVFNLIEKKDKIINEMAEMLLKDHEWFYSEFDNYAVADFIEYFEKKVGK